MHDATKLPIYVGRQERVYGHRAFVAGGELPEQITRSFEAVDELTE